MTRNNKLFVIRSNVATHGKYFAYQHELKRLTRIFGSNKSYEYMRAIECQAYLNVLHAIK